MIAILSQVGVLTFLKNSSVLNIDSETGQATPVTQPSVRWSLRLSPSPASADIMEAAIWELQLLWLSANGKKKIDRRNYTIAILQKGQRPFFSVFFHKIGEKPWQDPGFFTA
jgi:hypothetical protein